MGNIPKIIHYCWVGGAPKPKSVLYCIESWKKYCPDYEIREWNETNYDFSKNPYMKQAYEAKKWGFVPDYARLDIIYEYGGIYLDTDVEIIRSFDPLLKQEAFMGFEETGDGEYFVNCGQGFGAVVHNEIIKKARDLYDHIDFINADGSLNMVPSPYYTTKSLQQFGLIKVNREQELSGLTVYSSEVLCPKNFRTGKIKITDKTVSIHHFTASWLDDKIRKEMEKQQRIKNRYGEQLGLKILYIQSVFKKYSSLKMLLQFPQRVVRKVKKKIISGIEMWPYYKNLYYAKRVLPGKENCVLLDTAIDSDNTGDQIIMENCMKQLEEILPLQDMHHVSTHRFITEDERKKLLNAPMKILCGTNILSGHMRSYGLWKLNADVIPYLNTVLMGVGLASYDKSWDKYTRKLFHTILAKEYLHSVRDTFSEKMLQEMGIKNVIYTGCPTMWGLTSEHCKRIPKIKGEKVVCTITDYNRDPKLDRQMLEIANKYYEQVFVWIQGIEDFEYLQELQMENMVTVVHRGLENYDHILEQKEMDYIGTRLHAGVRALTFGHRTIVVSIDNRAECISKDTGLPIIKREDIPVYLEEKIQSTFETKIYLPTDNIKKWKQQFGKN